MKHTLFLTMLAAALLGSGVANAETLYASDYTSGVIALGTKKAYDKLVMDTPLTLPPGTWDYLDMYKGTTLEFLADNSGAICSILCTLGGDQQEGHVYFNDAGDYNIQFNEGAQSIIAASVGAPITLIEIPKEQNMGIIFFSTLPSATNLTLNGVKSGETISLGGIQFTYVGPKADSYTFQEGEIGFTGYYHGSHALNLVAKTPAVPEPTTGTLSLLALAALSARRRRIFK